MSRGLHKAVNRFITTLKTSSAIDSSADSGTFEVQDITVGGFSLPQGNCRMYATVDFAQTGKEEIFRIKNITGSVLTFDLRISVGGYNKPTHVGGASFRINDVSELVNDIGLHIDNCGFTEKIPGTQTIVVNGGNVNYKNVPYSVATAIFAITSGQLVDNSTNYVLLNLVTQAFVISATNTANGAIAVASVVCTGGSLSTITDLRPAFNTTYEEIGTKVDKAAGLRDSFGANKTVIVDRTSGAEVVKTSTVVSSIGDTDVFITRESAAGNEKIISYGNVKNQLAGAGKNVRTVLVGETIAGTAPVPLAIIAGSIPLTVTLGANVASVRVKSGITIKTTVTDTLGRVYTGQNATSASARIQLLNSAGTLITEKTPGIGTDYADFTDTIVKDTEYIICINDSTYFNTQSNELALVTYKVGNPFCMSGYLNGDKNAIPQAIRRIDFGTIKAMKAVANTTNEYATLGGFVIGPKALCDVVTLDSTPGLVVTGFTGLTKGELYYVSNTAGTISSTKGTIVSGGFLALSATDIELTYLTLGVTSVEYVSQAAGGTYYTPEVLLRGSHAIEMYGTGDSYWNRWVRPSLERYVNGSWVTFYAFPVTAYTCFPITYDFGSGVLVRGKLIFDGYSGNSDRYSGGIFIY